MARYYYREAISHDGLNKYRVVTAPTQYDLNQKVAAQRAAWDEQWKRKQQQEARRVERERRALDAAQSVRLAESRTRAAERVQEELDTILTRCINKKELCFQDLKSSDTFDAPQPQEGEYQEIPTPPSYDEERYHPKMPFFVSISAKKREEFEAQHRARFEEDYNVWKESARTIEADNASARAQYEQALDDWTNQKDEFYAAQESANDEIDELERRFNDGDPTAVSLFYELAIEAIKIPVFYEKRVDVQYDNEAKVLLVEYYLPNLEQLPSLKSVTYVKSRNDFKESRQTAAYMKRKYESVIYQLVMRILRCISSVDKRSHLVDSVVLNGRVETVDPATGQTIEPCVLSVTTSLEAFRAIKLDAVDPKAWFKSSKGVSAASIAKVTPVAPIMQLNREDKRFVEGYAVEERLDEGVNLAAMDWQDSSISFANCSRRSSALVVAR